jgi:uncharacterized protein (TIGR04141 family)
MKLNVFLIPRENVGSLKTKLSEVGMSIVYSNAVDEWASEFYFSSEPGPVLIPWVQDFSAELSSLNETPVNSLHYGAFIWDSGKCCFALSFGKTHFYLREFCDSDFGLDMARRIGLKDDVRQKAARRYSGRRKKEIRSYQRLTQLDVESGESVDYLQAATIEPERWGPTAKFGSSILLNPPIAHDALPAFFRNIQDELAKDPRFKLPRTEVITDDTVISQYDQELVEAIGSQAASFEEEGHQLVGVDFIFSGSQQYGFHYKRARSSTFDSLNISDLRSFIQEHNIEADQILNIKVRTIREDTKEYSQKLIKTLEYSARNDRVFLREGKWVRFNEDYAESLDVFIDEAIEIDPAMELDLAEIFITEPEFNRDMLGRGYEVADTDMSIVQLRGYKIEAWDLKKGKTAYAVKFGTTQDLGYVCDQAVNVLEIFRNDPAAFKEIELDTYCLWLVLERVTPLAKLSQLRSIILKQKLDSWARKCREMGIKPTVRLSRRAKKLRGLSFLLPSARKRSAHPRQ